MKTTDVDSPVEQISPVLVFAGTEQPERLTALRSDSRNSATRSPGTRLNASSTCCRRRDA